MYLIDLFQVIVEDVVLAEQGRSPYILWDEACLSVWLSA